MASVEAYQIMLQKMHRRAQKAEAKLQKALVHINVYETSEFINTSRGRKEAWAAIMMERISAILGAPLK